MHEVTSMDEKIMNLRVISRISAGGGGGKGEGVGAGSSKGGSRNSGKGSKSTRMPLITGHNSGSSSVTSVHCHLLEIAQPGFAIMALFNLIW